MGEIVTDKASVAEMAHKDLAAGRWSNMGLASQMSNIGSEVSRAIKWSDKGRTDRMASSLDRALELMDLTIDAETSSSRLKELCRAREELCDYFLGGNVFNTSRGALMAYYDQFVMVR